MKECLKDTELSYLGIWGNAMFFGSLFNLCASLLPPKNKNYVLNFSLKVNNIVTDL